MIRKTLQLILLLCVTVLLFSGCIITSIHPLYTEDDTPVFDKALIGTWVQKGEDYWMFKQDHDRPDDTPESESTYWLYVFDGKTTGKFAAMLFEIGDKRFLDIFPAEQDEGNAWYNWHLLPSHTFYYVELVDDELRLGLVDHEIFEKMVEENRADVEHMIYDDDRYLFTAKPDDLQKFMLRCVENGELTTEVYKRQKSE